MQLGPVIVSTSITFLTVCAYLVTVIVLAANVKKTFKPFDRALLTTDTFLPVLFALALVALNVSLVILKDPTTKRRIFAAWATGTFLTVTTFFIYGVFFMMRMSQAVNCRTFRHAAFEFFKPADGEHPFGSDFKASGPLSEYLLNNIKTRAPSYVRAAIFLGENTGLTLFIFAFLPGGLIGGGLLWAVYQNRGVWLPSFSFTENSEIKSRLRFRILPALSAAVTSLVIIIHGVFLISWNTALNFDFKPLDRVLLGSEFLFLVQLGLLSSLCAALYTIYPSNAPSRDLVYNAYIYTAIYFAALYLLYGFTFTIRLKFAVKGHSFRESVELFVKANPSHILSQQSGFNLKDLRITRFTPEMKQKLIEFAPDPVNTLYFLARNKFFTLFMFGVLPATLTASPAALAFDDFDEDPDLPQIDLSAIQIEAEEPNESDPLLLSSSDSSEPSVIADHQTSDEKHASHGSNE